MANKCFLLVLALLGLLWMNGSCSEKVQRDSVDKQQEKTTLVIGALVVIDYSIYKRWFEYAGRDRKKARTHIFYYYNHVIDKVDKMFQSIVSNKYTYGVQLNSLEIIESAQDSFTEVERVKDGATIDYRKALEELLKWTQKRRTQKFDVLVSFTKYRSNVEAGSLANVMRSCSDESVVLALDNGVYGTAEMAAYGIGQCLNARQDGVDNECKSSDHYAMSSNYSGGSTSNSDTFSPCSIAYFDEYVDSLSKEENCLLGSKNMKKIHININEESMLLGPKYSVDEQCKQNLGEGSYFCSEGIDSDDGKCLKMGCFETKVNKCIFTLGTRALDGTPCGKNKWCMDKKCVSSPSAKEKKEKCLHGDSVHELIFTKGRKKTCNEIKSMINACKHPSVNKRCCVTCKGIAPSKLKKSK